MKLLKYYLTSGTFEYPVIAIIAQVFLFNIYIPAWKKKSDQEIKLNLTNSFEKNDFSFPL